MTRFTLNVDCRAARPGQASPGEVAAKRIPTLEGLGMPAQPQPSPPQGFLEAPAECGYTINGMIMQAKALLDTGS